MISAAEEQLHKGAEKSRAAQIFSGERSGKSARDFLLRGPGS